MIGDSLIFVATSDLSGKTRGKAFPALDLEKRLARGMGWVPTNVQITCFDSIADTPFGALGDLLLVPDPTTEVKIDFQDDSPVEHFFLGDILTLEGEAWDFCTRSLLRSALTRLELVCGARIKAAFEHEFQLGAGTVQPHQGFGYQGHSEKLALGQALIAAYRTAGLTPDSFIREYGPDQFEVTVGPEEGLRAADAALILRELTRVTARRFGEQATFTPIRDVDSVGNGVHIHMSFWGDDGPLTYDPDGPGGMSKLTGSFAAGVLRYLDSIVALTAPSAVSYQRLTPHRWSAAFNNLGLRDREASLRICPTTSRDLDSTAKQFNIEYRAADAAASPYLALAAIVHAGCQGIEDNLAAPPITEEDLSLLSDQALADKGLVRLPTSLDQALEVFEANAVVRSWFPAEFAPVYIDHKRAELAFLDGLDVAGQCAAYEQAY